VSIVGTNLFPVTDDWSHSIVNGTLPISLDGVSVSMGRKPAYVYHISPGQINVLAPDISSGPGSVTVTTATVTSAALTATVSQYGPAFFLWPGSQVVATHLDYSYAVQAVTFSGFRPSPVKRSCCGRPDSVSRVRRRRTVLSYPAHRPTVRYQVPATLANGTRPIQATIGGVLSPEGTLLNAQ